MKSDKEYEIRFGVVMAMANYIDEDVYKRQNQKKYLPDGCFIMTVGKMSQLYESRVMKPVNYWK